jgi:arylsulfatase A-like enzyme
MNKLWFILAVIVSSVLSPAFSLPTKPNIIFILADDLGYGDLGCYGQQKIPTPHIDALAKRGIRFTQAYAGGPVCTPSRSVLMTGLHNGHTPARDNVPHYRSYLVAKDVTIAELLKEQGYRTGGIGKWSLGDPGTEGDATNQGFDMWFGYQNQDHAHYYFPEYLDDSWSPTRRVEYPGNSVSRSVYSHDVMTERALEFIDKNTENPFFLYAAYTVPHFSSGEEDPDKLAVPSLEPYSNKPWSLAAKKYGVMVSRLDKDVGRIVGRVEELGLGENTLIIFTSDQGPLGTGPYEELDNNGPLRGAKRSLYEGGIRVPFIAVWPGQIPADRVSKEIITFWDMLPTLVELSGGGLPTKIDGVSVLNAFLGKSLSVTHEYLYWDYGHTRRRYDQAVRWGRWKGVRLGVGSLIELYDLEADPGETNDISDAHPEVVLKIAQYMKEASIPSDRYPVGQLYRGSPIWKQSDHW